MNPTAARRRPGVRCTDPWLPLILLCSCAHFQCSAAAPRQHPEIISPLKPVRVPTLGHRFSISCQAHSPFLGMNLIYWLANGSFVEDQYPATAVSEGAVVEEPRGRGVLLTRQLLFHAFSRREWRTSWLCMVRNPAGRATAPIHWQPAVPAQGWEPQQETMEQGHQPPSAQTPGTGTSPQHEPRDTSARP
ncbi:interleukin-18-binding protein [Carettochelys insculpta]|uniref:interleukin-18-binding protein n=1 Tax=Carettochelys insculpta TaxID=44489 RepID=UPI003EBF25E5